VEREPVADVECAVEVGGAVQPPSKPLIECSRTLVGLQRPQRHSGHAHGIQPPRGLREQRPTEARSLVQGVNVETMDVPDPRRVIIVVLGRAVLAQPADVLAGAGDQHIAADLGLAARQLGPVSQPVRGKTLLVEGLREPLLVGRDPCLDMQSAQRRRIAGLSGPDCHGMQSAQPGGCAIVESNTEAASASRVGPKPTSRNTSSAISLANPQRTAPGVPEWPIDQCCGRVERGVRRSAPVLADAFSDVGERRGYAIGVFGVDRPGCRLLGRGV
jgi:hypothetical protein